MESKPFISIIIPSFNGLKHLQDFLELNLDVVSRYSGRAEIVICDDNSTDGSVDYIRMMADKYPSYLNYIVNTSKGACSARNNAVKISKGDYLLLIDNDFLLDANALEYLSSYCKDEYFCVSCCIYSYYNKDIQQDGIKLLKWRRGFPRFTHNIYNQDLDKILKDSTDNYLGYNVQGACFLCNKTYWDKLGGFDVDLFEPYLLEETDFAYRGLKRGWKIIYAPEPVGWHKVGGTITSKVSPFTKFLSKRNRFIFVWKNITDKKMFLFHILTIPMVIFKPLELKAFFAALKLRSVIKSKRAVEIKEGIVSDQELFKSSSVLERSIKSQY